MRTEPPPLNESVVYIGVGSNLGNREAHLANAVNAIKSLPHTVFLRRSRWYENPAVGIPDGEDFLNGVIEIRTQLTPNQLLEHLLRIERENGRDRETKDQREAGYRNRTLDLDILIFGDLSVNDKNLQIPHPRMWDREFVCIPLRELGLEHPDLSPE